MWQFRKQFMVFAFKIARDQCLGNSSDIIILNGHLEFPTRIRWQGVGLILIHFRVFIHYDQQSSGLLSTACVITYIWHKVDELNKIINLFLDTGSRTMIYSITIATISPMRWDNFLPAKESLTTFSIYLKKYYQRKLPLLLIHEH